ncbi:MAG: ATP-binding cassette domain-containing protein [Stomatobaculum sp.]|nr:ATP-binding cassette domain-containing protein [Stomatobaculum sp.]
MAEPLVSVRDLKVHFDVPGKGKLHAVDGVSFDIMPNETIGLVGESGCGKSTVGNALIRLVKATGGEVFFQGQEILHLNQKEMNEIRKKMQIIFQDPYSSLNPRETVSAILADPYQIHKLAKGAELKAKVKEMANAVGLEDYILDKFPHELDGGKRQMTGIARALALQPKFIICDEPVSALDVSVQATIINLLIEMQKKMGLSYLFISHDLSVVRHISNRIAVMYLGQIIEFAETDEIFSNCMHPYTIALLSAVPKVDFHDKTKRIVLEGDVPSPIDPEPGCRFAPRCPMAQECCRKENPELKEIVPGHKVACHFCREARQRMLG